MKKKEIYQIAAAAVIIAAVGYLAYTQLLPKGSQTSSSKQSATATVVAPISSSLSPTGLSDISNSSVATDYNIDLSTIAVGNTAPFGQ